jgi:hypothetical protein
MKRLIVDDDGNLGLALTVEAANALTPELRSRLQPALSALQADPIRPLPNLPPVRVRVDGEPVLELTTREALDLYFAFMQLLEEGASGTAEHTHCTTRTTRRTSPSGSIPNPRRWRQ